MKQASFSHLEPGPILDALENSDLKRDGFRFSGLWNPLNSYENRVIQVETNGREKWILKIYRPGRWTTPAIQEEHNFLFELNDASIPVLTPFRNSNGKSLFEILGFQIALFPYAEGTLCDELLPQDLFDLAQIVATVHEVGRDRHFQHRASMSAEGGKTIPVGEAYIDFIYPFIYPELSKRYLSASERLLNLLHDWLGTVPHQRIHGDLHRGNLLLRDDGFALLDFDDCCTGPILQDGWMLFSGDDNPDELAAWREGYNEISIFPDDQLAGIDLLRGLRIIQSSAWIARRWEDPNFPSLFSSYRDYNYWAEEVDALERITRNFSR